MQSENVYIGDDKFQRFLDHYNCPAPLGVVKLRFAGAVCSPNPNLRPTDVIASLFAENLQQISEHDTQLVQKTDTGGKSERHLPGYSEHGSDGGKDFSLFD